MSLKLRGRLSSASAHANYRQQNTLGLIMYVVLACLILTLSLNQTRTMLRSSGIVKADEFTAPIIVVDPASLAPLHTPTVATPPRREL